ncbi:MAG: DNA polymerase III subunit gamma/tau [Acidobacteriota bacterium]|nr:DNA polymerase III subunit gamma/tau [Acidobacteriota bacterium]
MSYQVLARKWRPQRFEEVVGQETVTKTLKNAIEESRIAHAFLFSGVRGVGKTSAARILAKALNCQKGPTATPCCACDPCQEVASACSMDVLEIDAASNTGVDNIRELRDSVRYGTARDRFKIFIIDEVHMLSNAAFNALLKTLEEPPSHVKFILATTQYEKIPVTIISRCQQFSFRPIPFRLIVERLKFISQEEKIKISDYALKAIVSGAQGSMRDAQSTLDRVIAFSGKKIQDEDVQTLLGVIDEKAVVSVVDAVLDNDARVLIRQVEDLTNSGVEPQHFCRKLIQHVRNLMVCQVAGGEEQLLDLADGEKETALRQAEKFSSLDLIRFYDLLNSTAGDLRWNLHPWVHLELTLIKLVELRHLPSVEEVISKLNSESESTQFGKGQQAEDGVLQTEKSNSGSVDIAETSSAAREEIPLVEEEDVGKVEETSNEIQELKSTDERDAVADLLKAVQRESIGLYSSIQHAFQTTFTQGKLSILFLEEETFHYQVVSKVSNQDQLSRICAEVMESEPQIEILLRPNTDKVDDSSKDSMNKVNPTDNPKFKSFIETFPGTVVVEQGPED